MNILSKVLRRRTNDTSHPKSGTASQVMRVANGSPDYAKMAVQAAKALGLDGHAMGNDGIRKPVLRVEI